MFRQLLINKKVTIVTLSVLLALIVGFIILITPNTKESNGEPSGTKAEQSKEDDGFDNKAENKGDDTSDVKNKESSRLEVLDSDETTTENSSNVSGAWGNSSGSSTQAGNTNQTDKVQPGDDKKQDNGHSENQEDILEDDITWGQIY